MIITLAGLQWGDEGKGKIADLLSHHADLVIRFQGGNNAGHSTTQQNSATYSRRDVVQDKFFLLVFDSMSCVISSLEPDYQIGVMRE